MGVQAIDQNIFPEVLGKDQSVLLPEPEKETQKDRQNQLMMTYDLRRRSLVIIIIT